MTPTHTTPTAISEEWFTALAEAVHSDRETQVIGRYSDFWIGAVSPGNWQVALSFRISELVPAPWEDLPREHILISATQAGWEQIFDPQPKPLHHDLLALAKNSPDVTVSGSDVELVRNLRVIARLIDLGKALHAQH
ncbi:hypothetical protein ARGLB_037_01100 [Arthrobacter globiformis NBRC 12137]|uniref:SCP2 domain-containing protein n=1 Tax=Arthrobacter globiformis (strain ATCC 8010 / DSM 20124 / JCM 1332 / NBRC 12137 / NCIMB 8907 / NRRL B-2979 / 168) TaxID=1077972 RepID=H0QK19_ARTG1|nr:hypothetical protein [Arthrobacter globiformis]GAB13259.1 hypothetical protein ARGLB_037_01100 [Arthrobacter globiformis NBRC 12137]